jgi:GT2 family glycosyltransferase
VWRFRQIARSDGLGVALARAAGKIQRRFGRRFRFLIPPLLAPRCPYFTPPLRPDPYDAWRLLNRDNPGRRRSLQQAMNPPGPLPRFSVVVPVYDPGADALRAMIESVASQTFTDWEMVLVNNGSTQPHVRQELEAWSSRDERIKVIHRRENGNICRATNEAAAAASGEFLVFSDSDDILVPDALAHLALYLNTHPDTDLLYSDDDKLDGQGRCHSPQFKPDWSPELLLSFCYVSHLTAVRRRLYDELGGLRVGFDGSQDHDFWLRASERTDRIGHIPQVLYHWRVVAGSGAAHHQPASVEAGRRAVEEAFQRRGVACPVEQIDWAAKAGCAIFQPVMPDDGPSVAILLLTHNQKKLLERLIDSLAKTTYRNYRVYVVDNASDDPATLRYLETQPHQVLYLSCPNGQFNFAAINNQAAAMVEEELLLFLNDDMQVINPRWLSQMVGWSRLSGVGAVGARLLFPDGRVQHAGIVHGFHEGRAGHAFRLLPWWEAGHLNLARVSRNCLAVTAACLLTPRNLFLRLGGFDAKQFAVIYNDADYGYRLADAGYRSVYCAEAELYHHEGANRGFSQDPREIAAYRQRHGHRTDPYFSPHLDPDDETFQTKPTVVPAGSDSRPIRLLAVTHNLNWEGAPRIEFEIVRGLRASGSVQPEILSPSDGPLRLDYEQLGITLRVEPSMGGLASKSPQQYQEAIDRLAGLIVGEGFDVVHANTLQTFWAIAAAQSVGIPSVWSVHESEPWQSYFDDLPREIGASALSCLAYPYRVVFSARSSARVWSDLNTHGNVELIRFAHDVPRLRSELEGMDRDQARQALNLDSREFCVLLLGTVCERKGQHDLVRAFAALPSEIAARMRCLVVGARQSLAYSRRLQQLAAQLSSDRRERFLVIPETGQTAVYWKAADLFCCTSRLESYPLVILEAMALGLPIITTPVFGIAEQVRPSFNALTYRPGDTRTLARHLALLAQNEHQRRALAQGSQWVLGSLPGRYFMDVHYRRILRAAAESAPFRLSNRRTTTIQLNSPHHGPHTSGQRSLRFSPPK